MMIWLNTVLRALIALWAFSLLRLLVTLVVLFYPGSVLDMFALPSINDVLEYAFVASLLNFGLRGYLYGWASRFWRRWFGDQEVGHVDEA